MIASLAMSSTSRAFAAALLAVSVSLAGCSNSRLPPYGAPGRPDAGFPAADTSFTMADGAVLPVRTWLPAGPPKAVILALHGFNDSRDQWAIPASSFTAAGIAIYAPDQRGFGDTASRGTWPGVPALVNDTDTMATALLSRYPGTPVYVMGESMGGAVAMDLAAQPNHPAVAGVIMLSPAVWGRAQEGAVLTSALWLADTVAPGYRITAGDVPVRVQASDNRDALIALAKDPLTLRRTKVADLAGLVDLMDSAQAAAPHVTGPTFLAYGEHDELVPPAALAVAWAHLPAATRRALYPNGYHLLMRDQDRQDVIGDVISWIQAPDALLPSGADFAAAAWATRYHPGGGLQF